ncbi:MAG TPA: protein kinase [Vicinamibacteria bacterium]|nr:protein kinase [Vicinamibacteria bacterium]
MSQPTAVDLVQQKQFGRYEILSKLGAGGMGEVYRARDLTLGRAVAIKVLRGPAFSDQERRNRFEQEARSASALNHPNIVTIYEISSVGEVRYIAMELVEGRTLREILHEGHLLTRRALQLAAQAAEGLAQAHAAGIVHRDLKPENIMVAQGRVKILDFGLAKVVATADTEDAPTGGFLSPVTEPGRVLGTVGYMSPEQAMGLPLDFRSDQFSCGAILYEMVTGFAAFRRPSPAQTMTAIIEDDPRPIADLNPAVPPPLRWIIERCLAKDPAERYASTWDMARDLANVLDHFDEVSSDSRPSAPAVPSVSRPVLPPRLGARRARIAAAVALVGLAGGVAWFLARPGAPALPGRAAAARPGGRRAVAVLGFKNLSGQPETAWLSTAFAEMLTTELAAGGRLRTIPGENVARMKRELSLSDAESLAGDTLARVARNLGTDMVLLGSYVTLPGEQIRLDLRLQDVATGETVSALGESGTTTGLVDLVTRAGSDLRQSMSVENPPSAEAGGLAAGAPSNLEAQRLYAEGLARLRELDALAARDLLQKAVAADPRSPLAHGALADAWAALGYDESARRETQRAYDLSAGLSREDRLAVEGRYRETSGEWARATEIYGALVAFFPDNVEYGLRLAGAQNTAGKGREALDTLAKMRGLLPAAAQDPRIDVAEALVAQSLGDFRREQAAAGRAATKGAARGAGLLVARARLLEAYALDRLGQIQEAAGAAEDARRIYAAAGDRGGLAQALNRIGSVFWNHGELEKARATWEEALAVRRQIGYRAGVAVSVHNLGLLLWEQGDLAGARRNLEEGLAIDRERGDRPGVAIDLENLAGLLLDSGDLPGARKLGDQALSLSREVGDPTEAALALMRLGMVLHAGGELREAGTRYREALPALQERGARDSVADTLFQIGELRKAEGDLAAARTQHEEAQAIRTSFQGAFVMAKSRVALAVLAIDEEHSEAAGPLLVPALETFSAQKASDWQAAAQAVLARSLLGSRRLGDARNSLDRALALSAKSLSPHVRLSVAETAARVEAAEGRAAMALDRLDAALAEAVKLGLVADQIALRLARGEVGLAAARPDAVADLRALVEEARARGFGLAARSAEAALGSRPPKPRRAS